jgi:hypothetical protein
MDTLPRQVAQSLVDHALTIDAANPGEGFGDNLDGEMAFTRSVIAHMATMMVAVVGHDQLHGRKGGSEQGFDFGLDCAFYHKACLGMHAGLDK